MAESENEGMRSQSRELADLKREVADLRNVVINTGGVLKSIQRDMTSIRQKAQENFKRTVISAGAAYMTIAVLALLVGVLLSRNTAYSERRKVDEANAKVEAANLASEQAKKALDDERQAAATWKTSRQHAVTLYRQLTSDQLDVRMQGFHGLEKLDRNVLNEMENAALNDAVARLQAQAGENALEKAKTAFRRQQMRSAAEHFDQYFAFKPSGSEENLARYMAGTAYFELRDFEKAADYLEPYVARGKSQRHHQYATNMLGQALDKVGDKERAFKVYDQGVADYPNDQTIRARQNALARVLGRRVAVGASAPSAPTDSKPAEAPAATTSPAGEAPAATSTP